MAGRCSLSVVLKVKVYRYQFGDPRECEIIFLTRDNRPLCSKLLK